MQEKTRKIVLIASLVVAILAGVFAVLFALNQTNDSLFGVAAYIMYAIVILSLVAILGFAIWNWAKSFKNDRKSAIKVLGIVVAMVVIFLISWLCASSTDVSEVLLQKNNLSEGASKLVGAACISVYILFGISILAIVYTEVAKLIKKK